MTLLLWLHVISQDGRYTRADIRGRCYLLKACCNVNSIVVWCGAFPIIISNGNTAINPWGGVALHIKQISVTSQSMAKNLLFYHSGFWLTHEYCGREGLSPLPALYILARGEQTKVYIYINIRDTEVDQNEHNMNYVQYGPSSWYNHLV